ncbi:hypothetical protein GQ44DRAFT_711660 [Phaeosphaeriaceae sp. PMI808]|nr:hypothetical protein GQ44DRAFT_711660 [Phaeosphaeriaceae sp. PMI808]
MAIMFQQPLASSKMQPEGQPQDLPTYYGHLRRYATICNHSIHPSASPHMPLCPACTTSRAKCRMDAALKGLAAEGGLLPAEYMRDRRWQRAKLQYEIAKQRQAKARSRDQLRIEREQAWEEAHQQVDSPCHQATAVQDPAECLVCASLSAYYSSTSLKVQATKNVTWWERPGGLVADHILVRGTPLRSGKQVKPDACQPKRPSTLRTIIKNARRSITAVNAQRQTWDRRYRTESAVRRKHSLGEEHHFEPEFWDAPISAYYSRQQYESEKDDQRMAARRARGNISRPRPPRSSLSYVECPDEVEVDKNMLKRMRKKEEREAMDRAVRKAGEEVGYLYFVGEVNGLWEWKEDFLRSDRQLVFRKALTMSDTEAVSTDSTEVGDEGDEEGDDDIW